MKNLPEKIQKARRVWQEKGWRGISRRAKIFARQRRAQNNYQKWRERNKISDEDRSVFRQTIENFPHKPLISIILPVYNTEEKWLRKCLESVGGQIYDNWELCIADDFSDTPCVRRILQEYAAKDKRIKCVFRTSNGHISAASNSALEIAAGEFAALLDHDDELAEDALFHLVREINNFPEADFIYTDEDMIDAKGKHFSPKFKPDWSPDFLYSVNYVTHFAVYRTEILRKIGSFREGFEGSQDYDLALRFVEQIDEKRIRHIPRILYHWRSIQGSVALASDEKPYAHERARTALREHFERMGKAVKVERGIYELHRVRYDLPESLPKVSLILWSNKDEEIGKTSAVGVIETTDYQNIEIQTIYVKNQSAAESLNRAVSQSAGEILCFADVSLRPLSDDWLKELASFAIQKEIGAVGGKILRKDEKIGGGSLIFGFERISGIAHENLPREADGNLFRAQVVNNFSAVSVSCMVVRREIFDETGGFDAVNLPDSLFDADFCLKLRERNLRIVFTPFAEMIQTGKIVSQTKISAKESKYFRRKWHKILENDPFYNPNLSLTGETFTIKL